MLQPNVMEISLKWELVEGTPGPVLLSVPYMTQCFSSESQFPFHLKGGTASRGHCQPYRVDFSANGHT